MRNEVSLCRVDEFIKFDEFNEKLPVIGCVENITDTYLWSLLVKFTFHLCCLFIQMCTFSFFIISLLINYNYLTSFYSSHFPDKFIKFNEFNKILKRENSIVPIQFYFLHVVLTYNWIKVSFNFRAGMLTRQRWQVKVGADWLKNDFRRKLDRGGL